MKTFKEEYLKDKLIGIDSIELDKLIGQCSRRHLLRPKTLGFLLLMGITMATATTSGALIGILIAPWYDSLLLRIIIGLTFFGLVYLSVGRKILRLYYKDLARFILREAKTGQANHLLAEGNIMQKYMVDTNIFNYILDHIADIGPVIGKAEFLATHIQMDELTATSDIDRRCKLLQVFKDITSSTCLTESAVWGISRFGQAKFGGSTKAPPYSSLNTDDLVRSWTQEDDLFSPIKDRLDVMNGGKKNNAQDALISETSIKNGCILITHDRDLFLVTTEYGGACANIHAAIFGITRDNISEPQGHDDGIQPEEIL